MYEIQFFKKTGGTGRIYAWGCDLEKAKFHIEDYGHSITRINKLKFFKWLYYAYIKEPHKRYKLWWE